MDLLEGVTARTVDTDRLRLHVYESGPADGVPVLLVHGNLSTGRFYEHVMSGAPDRYRLIAPDMRGFGRTERVPIDATRGLADWADDLHALLRALRVERPVHLAGWSTGGAAVATYAGRARNPVLLDRSTWPDVSACAIGDMRGAGRRSVSNGSAGGPANGALMSTTERNTSGRNRAHHAATGEPKS